MPEYLRSCRAVPYPGSGASVHLPEEAWLRTLKEIRAYGRRRSEALIFWGGVVSGASCHVTGIYLPGHRADGAHVALNGDESRWLIRQLHGRDEKLIAQVHSHPGKAYHSRGDDSGAASFHVGFLSIVVPHYGRGVMALRQCAVFESDGVAFVELADESIVQRFRLRRLAEPRPLFSGPQYGAV